jgi:transcriptional regulator with XRE-family HTH domain
VNNKRATKQQKDQIVSIQQPKNKHHDVIYSNTSQATDQVGHRLRSIRKARNLSIRALAERSDLSVNTLSLIENGRTSPSVSTLTQLAKGLKVPITIFFESDAHNKKVVYQKASERKQIIFSQGKMESLGAGLSGLGSEPFITRLEPGANSGDTPIIYAGREFIYCLEGQITYTIENQIYPLDPSDSLILAAYTPHSWRNTAPTSSRALLVLCPDDSFDDFPERYFMP